MQKISANYNKKVAVVGCKHTTKDLILGLRREGYLIDHCLTLDPDKGKEHKVAGFYDLRPFLKESGIPFTTAKTYSLKDIEDKQRLLDLELDMLLVAGWQRLIPDWWLEKLSVGAFGMHGSSKPLPHGRGRSPMNWSLIQNKNIFYTHLFQYKAGVDDGPIVGVQTFDITPFDTCLTLHFKNMISMTKLASENLPDLLTGKARLLPQNTEGATYYPKREAEDGLIFWEDKTFDIYNHIRAVTDPFPGAFTYLNNEPSKKIIIWEAIPFDTHLKWPKSSPGLILEVFFDGKFVVKTGDSTLLVTGYEGHTFTDQDVGLILSHLNLPRKKWENLPE